MTHPSFSCFLAKNRSDFMKECAGKPVTAVTKLASEPWFRISWRRSRNQPGGLIYSTVLTLSL